MYMAYINNGEFPSAPDLDLLDDIINLESVPAYIKVIETVRSKYACKKCEQTGTENSIKVAPVPATPTPKSIATSNLLSQIISSKYQYGLPLYRQEKMFN